MVTIFTEDASIPRASLAPIAPVDRTTRETSVEALQYFSKGVTLSKQGKPQEALGAFEEALTYDERLPEAWYGKGTVLGELGEYQGSLEALDQALSLRPEDPDCWHNKGVALGRLGLAKEALEAFEQALGLRPVDAQTWLGKGAALLAQQNNGAALDAFEQALGYTEKEPLIWSAVGVTLVRLGRFGEAQQAFQRAYDLKDGPSDRGAVLYKPWAGSALVLGVDALVNQDVKAFEEAGLAYIDVLEKAQDDNAGRVVEDLLTQFKLLIKKTKKRRSLKAFEELELFIGLMTIKDPFEGWRAVGKAMSERWPKGLSAVKAVREMRR